MSVKIEYKAPDAHEDAWFRWDSLAYGWWISECKRYLIQVGPCGSDFSTGGSVKLQWDLQGGACTGWRPTKGTAARFRHLRKDESVTITIEGDARAIPSDGA